MGDFPSRYADGENHHGHQRPSGCPQGREVSFLLIQAETASRFGLIQALASNMSRPAEYAIEYTKRERMRFLAVGATLSAAVVLISRLWFFPWLEDFASNAHCRTVLGAPGPTVLRFSLFFGLPLSTAALLAATLGRRGLKIVRQGQVPPAGEKVLRPTIIRRGERARLIGYAHLLIVLTAAVLAIWGFAQATKMDESFRPSPGSCAANNSSKPTPFRGAT